MSETTGCTAIVDEECSIELGLGRIGVVAARAGVGKSTCLVCLALNELVKGRQVLHVSIDTPVAHVRASYDAALDALGARDVARISTSLRFEIERRRVIHSYLSGAFSPTKLVEALGFLAEHMDFGPSMIIIDGIQFDSSSAEDIVALARVAEQSNVELWMSALIKRDEAVDEETGLPSPLAPFAEHFDVVLRLQPEGEKILIFMMRKGGSKENRQLQVMLDPNSRLLVCE